VPSAGTLDSNFGTGGAWCSRRSGWLRPRQRRGQPGERQHPGGWQRLQQHDRVRFRGGEIHEQTARSIRAFGSGGLVTTDFFGGNDMAHAMAVLGNGDIVVAGTAFQPGHGQPILRSPSTRPRGRWWAVSAAGAWPRPVSSAAATTRRSPWPFSPTASLWWPATPTIRDVEQQLRVGPLQRGRHGWTALSGAAAR